MAAFEYRAINAKGRTVRGIFEGDTVKLARQQLRGRGLRLLSIQEVHNQEKSGSYGLFSRRPGNRQMAHLTRQLAALLKSGLAVDEALSVLARQTDSARLGRLLAGLRARIVEGQSLAQACQAFPGAFNAMYRATIAAGESSGKLDAVLARLADYISGKGQVHRKLQMALMYPALLTLVSLLVVIALLALVVPEITGVFDKMGRSLPALTVALIAVSDFLKHYGLLLLLAIAAAALLLRLALRRPAARMKWHRFLLTAPGFRTFSRGLNAARFTRTLAILTNSGVELLEALKIAGQVLSNDAMAAAMATAALKVREGQSLTRALERCGFFPPITLHLIASGEAGGQLPQMLENAADDQEQELQALTELALGLFEPGLILAMGALVLLIVLAILLPIFEMNELIR